MDALLQHSRPGLCSEEEMAQLTFISKDSHVHFTHPRKHKKAGMLPDAFQGDKRHRHTAMSADALERLGHLTPYSLNVTFQREKRCRHMAMSGGRRHK